MIEIIKWTALYAVTIYFALMAILWMAVTVANFTKTRWKEAHPKDAAKVFAHLFIVSLWFGLFFSMMGFIIP